MRTRLKVPVILDQGSHVPTGQQIETHSQLLTGRASDVDCESP